MSQPLISVAMCTFNSERYLAEQLQSVLEQTVLPHEVVISDDGSTDRTFDIIHEVFAQAPFKVTVLSDGVSRGVTGNFEQALSTTTGDVVLLSDHDDRWHPKRVERSVASLASTDLPWAVHSDARIINGAGEPTGDTLLGLLSPSDEENAALSTGELFNVYVRRNLATGATMALTRELLDVALPIPSSWVHDEWLAMHAAVRDKLRFSPEQWIDYRIHGANEIGAKKATLAHKISRVLARDAGRNQRLSDRAADLTAALRSTDAPSDIPAWEERLNLLESKAAFEAARAGLPKNRLARFVPVLRLARQFSYRQLASQGTTDVMRDLMQPR